MIFLVLSSLLCLLSLVDTVVGSGISNDILSSSSARNGSYNTPACEVPRFPPYFWVKDVSKDTILMGVTDPNKDNSVKGYIAYFWGHRFGAESTIE